jgi:hypothetical protein
VSVRRVEVAWDTVPLKHSRWSSFFFRATSTLSGVDGGPYLGFLEWRLQCAGESLVRGFCCCVHLVIVRIRFWAGHSFIVALL